MSRTVKTLAEFVKGLPGYLSERARVIRDIGVIRHGEFVLYWTHHALRCDENPALDISLNMAKQLNVPLLVYHGLSENYPFASDRHHTFMMEAAIDLKKAYAEKGIRYGFYLSTRDNRQQSLLELSKRASVVITDAFPLSPTKLWIETLTNKTQTPIVEVDTSCVVPMQIVGKAFDRAFAFRDATRKEFDQRIHFDWPDALGGAQANATIHFDGPLGFDEPVVNRDTIADLVSQCDVDHAVGPVGDTSGGFLAGYQRWESFKREGLKRYAKLRNDASVDGVSRMSAYLHYGMVSPFKLAREASLAKAEKYLDELLIWRELAYSFCMFRDDVDTLQAIPNWAKDSLTKHVEDSRELILSWESTARARSSDRLWDAAQRSLIRHGELHNNLRMTWGKGILEWTANPSESLRRLIDLNHRYALDGRDPASYGGLLWCLGQFDRPFTPTQPITGTVRSRPTKDHLRRIDIETYEKRINRPIAGSLPKVAIIGAGLAGVMCGRILSDHGIDVQLFEKSYRPGGRCATRKIEQSLQFDTGAQYFTCKDKRLAKYVCSWLDDGIVAPWHGKIVEVILSDASSGQSSDHLVHHNDKTDNYRIVGLPTMDAIGRHLANDLSIHYKTKVIGVSKAGDQYAIDTEDARSLGLFDHIVLNCPPVQVDALVPEYCSWKQQLQSVSMQPTWAITVAFHQRYELPFDGAFINSGPFSWIARDSSKPSRPKGLDCWVLHSSVDWAIENLNAAQDDVKEKLMSALEEIFPSVELPLHAYVAAQRWLYARPEIPMDVQCLWDEANGLGACGDWCSGARVEGALLSGMAMAGRILGSMKKQSPIHLGNYRIESSSKTGPSERQLDLFE